MNRFIKAAIDNMEMVEGDDRHPNMRQELTQAAIAYALIAIAESLSELAESNAAIAGEMIDPPEPRYATHSR